MKYWTYMKGEVPGSYEPAQLAALPGFAMTTLVCPGEGEIAEKNWRRAGEFEDIVSAVSAHQAGVPPAAPLGAPPTSNEVDALLDTASTRLFSHVADLMKELETRRDEKSLIVSLQRQISALKQELTSSHECTTMLEIRMPRLAELEEASRKHQDALTHLQATIIARETQLNELRAPFERMRGDLDTAKRRVSEAENDLGIRNRLVDKLSHDLSEKELSLAKALGVIRRLEEDLNRLCPSPDLLKTAAPAAARVASPPPAAQTPAAQTVEPVEKKVLSVAEFNAPAPPPDAATFTLDDPPPPPPYLEPVQTGDFPKAQQALMGLLKKIFPDKTH